VQRCVVVSVAAAGEAQHTESGASKCGKRFSAGFLPYEIVIGPGMWVQKATVFVHLLLVVAVISSLRVQNPQGFLNTQRSATKLCKHIHADLAHRSTVSDCSLIF